VVQQKVEQRTSETTSSLLASGYTSTVLGIAGLSLIVCVSLLMTVQAISDLDQGNPYGADLVTSMRALKL
jgi:hypothetical protein